MGGLQIPLVVKGCVNFTGQQTLARIVLNVVVFQAMRLSAGFCITGWLAVYFSKVRSRSIFKNINKKEKKIVIRKSEYTFSNVPRVQGAWFLDMGRFCTGYGMGVFSYVVNLAFAYHSIFMNTAGIRDEISCNLVVRYRYS